MVSKVFAIMVALVIAGCVAHPVKQTTTKRRSIADQIIDPSVGEFVSEKAFKAYMRQSGGTDSPTVDEAAGITSSRIGFMQANEVGSAFDIPGIRGFRVTASLSGSIFFTGNLASDIETDISNITDSFSEEFAANFTREDRRLRSRARSNYFFFHQAAANFGLSQTRETDEFRASDEFSQLAQQTNSRLNTVGRQELEAVYDIEFTGVSDGRAQRVFAFAFLRINQIQLDSGRILNVIQTSPDAVVANGDNEVIDDQPEADVEVRRLDDFIIDTNLANRKHTKTHN